MEHMPVSTFRSQSTYRIQAPIGDSIEIPVSVKDDTGVSFSIGQWTDLRAFYDREGYVVVRSLIPVSLCEHAYDAFQREVKPYKGFLYRQASANPERHVFAQQGFMLNSLLNIQDLRNDLFPKFRQGGLAILTHPNMRSAVATLLGEEGTLVQSMFFEGNPVTWAHQDTYYLDSAELGRMTAAWIAVEDINPGAGRFYVYPGSHRIEMPRNQGNFSIAFSHETYKTYVASLIRDRKLACRAPALGKGDVLFWNSRTIHGSLETTQPEASRCSFTAHYIPATTEFMQYQVREKALNLVAINSMKVHCPKDQNKVINRVLLNLETTFPKTYQFAKKSAIKILTRG